jgi:hypothetical protein
MLMAVILEKEEFILLEFFVAKYVIYYINILYKSILDKKNIFLKTVKEYCLRNKL